MASASTASLTDLHVSSLPRGTKLLKPTTLQVSTSKRGVGGRRSMPNIASALHQYMLSKPIAAELEKSSNPSRSNETCNNIKKAEKDQSNTNPSVETADDGRSNALQVFSKVAALPSLLADKVKATQAKQIEAGDLINLTFLSEEEIATIQKVVQADLKLRRSILGSMKTNIDNSEPQNTSKPPEEDDKMLCANCSKDINLVCTRLFSGKCSDCKRILCKQCTGKKTQKDLSVLCLSCKNRRFLKMQTLDYESILNYGVRLNGQVKEIPTMAESELVKKSLQAAINITRPRKLVEFASGHTGSLPRPSQLKSIGKSASFEAESLQLPTGQGRSISKQQFRSKSASLTINDRVPSITDADCGFQLVSKSSEDSLVDLCSVYSEQCYFGVEITGRILLGIWYKAEEKRLYIRIVKAENLSEAADGALDPYVKTYLLPGVYKSNKRKTGLQYDTTKPVWNEIIKYADLTQEEVCGRTLWLSVWDWNRYGRQQFLGEVRVPLGSRDLTKSKDEWYKLQDSENKPSLDVEEVDSPDQPVKPRLLLALMFKPYTADELAKLRKDKKGTLGCLYVKVVKAENLPAMDVNDRTDSFARCFLFPNLQLGGKKKTKIIENSLNPVWEDEMIYSYLSVEELQCERVLEVTLWDYDRRGTNQFIGGIRIGPNPFDVIHSYDWLDSTDTESSHWEDVIDKPGEWVEAWHNLRPSMDSMHKLKSKLQIPEGSMSSGSLPMDIPGNDGRDSPTISSPKSEEGDTSLEVNITRSKKGNYQITGEVLIGIKYSGGFLYLKIVKAAGLSAVHRNGISNPYIKVYLLPDRSKESKRKTEVKFKSLDPVYKEVFKYKVDPADIHLRTLWITVWDHGSFGANHFMGETCISLTGNLRHSSERWYELHDFAESGMVVMATPFGRTPTHHLPKTSSHQGSPPHSDGEALDNGSPPHPEPPLLTSTPKPSTDLNTGEAVPDTTQHTIPSVPTVTVEDFETVNTDDSPKH